MLFLDFISGKRIGFPGKWAKTLKSPGSLTSTQLSKFPPDPVPMSRPKPSDIQHQVDRGSERAACPPCAEAAAFRSSV